MATSSAPAARFLQPADYAISLWKNGLGETVEVARAPARAAEETGFDNFDWRVSYAAVVADGPFSEFPGIKRTIMVFEGDGMELTLRQPDGAETLQRLLPFAPFTYPGETPVHGRLLNGPVRDLNLMCRRSRCEGAVEIVRSAVTLVEQNPSTVTLLFAIAGSADVDIGGATQNLPGLHAVLIQGACEVGIRPFVQSRVAVLRVREH